MSEKLDIGFDHVIEFTQWAPDRALNPQYADIPDINPLGAIIDHKKKDGTECFSGIIFDLPGIDKIVPGRAKWHVESLNPLTLSPSILCMICGDHGFIRNGKWVPA